MTPTEGQDVLRADVIAILQEHDRVVKFVKWEKALAEYDGTTATAIMEAVEEHYRPIIEAARAAQNVGEIRFETNALAREVKRKLDEALR